MTDSHQSEENLADLVAKRIEEEHITPRPRWVFTAENAGFWALGVVAVLLGAAASAAAFFEVANRDWALGFAAHPNLFSYLIQSLPLLWIAGLLIFAVFCYRYVRQTRRGYRYPVSSLLAVSVLFSIAIGGILFVLGAGQAIEEGIGDHPPLYRPVLLDEEAQWNVPAEGLVAGQIASVTPSTFTLTTFTGGTTTIDAEDIEGRGVALSPGEDVRVVGVPSTSTASATPFHACFIFPWDRHERIASTSGERIYGPPRTDICKGIRPYGALHKLED